VLHVTLLCSDEDCAELVDATVESLDELNGLTCDCGYGVVALRVEQLELV
jgi:hypothetical protein